MKLLIALHNLSQAVSNPILTQYFFNELNRLPSEDFYVLKDFVDLPLLEVNIPQTLRECGIEVPANLINWLAENTDNEPQAVKDELMSYDSNTLSEAAKKMSDMGLTEQARQFNSLAANINRVQKQYQKEQRYINKYLVTTAIKHQVLLNSLNPEWLQSAIQYVQGVTNSCLVTEKTNA